MLRKLRLGSRWVSPILALTFLFVTMPTDLVAQSQSPGEGSITGFLYGTDGKTPVQGAVVRLRNVTISQEFKSQPTDATGLFNFASLPVAQYALGATIDGKDFNFDRGVSVTAHQVATVSFALPSGSPAPLQPKGTDQKGMKKKGAWAFFKRPAGLLLLLGGSVPIIAAVARESEEEQPTSPPR